MPNFTFSAEAVRKLDRKPVNGKSFPTEYIFYVKLKDLPGSKDDESLNIPSEVNIRSLGDIEKMPPANSVYGKLESSIRSEDIEGNFSPETNLPGFFLYRNKGISIAARDAKPISDDGNNSGKSNLWQIEIADLKLHGIFDGGHTYKTLIDNRQKPDGTFYDECVKLTVFTNFESITNERSSDNSKLLPEDIVNQIAIGQNTTIQVEEDSIADSQNLFQDIKEALRNSVLDDEVSYEQNTKGKSYRAKDLIAYMASLNIKAFPNDEEDSTKSIFPLESSTSTAKPLQWFVNSMKTKKENSEYKSLAKLLKEIVTLVELIKVEGAVLYLNHGIKNIDVPKKFDPEEKNSWFIKALEKDDSKYKGAIEFSSKRNKGKIEPDSSKKKYHFTGQKSPIELKKGCLMPLLSAFRAALIIKDDGSIDWDGGFNSVINLWNESKSQLIFEMWETGDDDTHRATQLTKKRSLWRQLHRIVKNKRVNAFSKDKLLEV